MRLKFLPTFDGGAVLFRLQRDVKGRCISW
jgi:hypothetical protein